MSAARIVGAFGLIVALAAAPATGAAAQKVPPPAGSVPVPAGGAIGSLEIVTAAQIAATAAADIRAALALVPTLVIVETGGRAGTATLSLRGSTSREVLVLVDGHRVSGAPGAAFNLYDLAVPVDRVARIEVVPAPASVIYGPDALGGVVNIVTIPAGATPTIAVSYGRGGEAEQRIAGGVQYGVKSFGLRLDAQLLSGDGYRDNGEFDLKNFTVNLAVAPAPWGLDVRWTSYEREAGVPGPLAHPSPEALRKDAHDGLRADLIYRPGGGWDLKAGVFTRSQSLRFTDPAPPLIDPLVPSAPVDLRRENSSYGVGAELDFDTKRGELFTVGAEWVDDRVEADGDEDRAAERWSVYTQDQWRSGAWSAVGAIRRDQHSEYGGRTSPSLQVAWGSGGWKLWAGWARNFRTPSFDELFLDEQFRKGNRDLEPETSESFDGGIEMGGTGWNVRLAAFRRTVDNLVSWTDADGDRVFRPENIARATVSGWEAQMLYRLSKTITIPVGYQRLSTQDEDTHESLPGVVRTLWRAAVQGVGSSLTWSLEYAATDRGEEREGGRIVNYTTVNAALGWRDEIYKIPVRLALRVENLQDRVYETVAGYPMPGRTWFAEVKIGW